MSCTYYLRKEKLVVYIFHFYPFCNKINRIAKLLKNRWRDGNCNSVNSTADGVEMNKVN